MRAEEASALFDANAARYDRVNAVVSAGLERHWREWVAARAVPTPGVRVLDAFAGTGAVGIECARRGAEVLFADASEGMLHLAEERLSKLRPPPTSAPAILSLDLTAPPAMLAEAGLAPGSFDAITAVFAVRYLDAPAETLRNLATLLHPEGRFIVMEFVEPPRTPLGLVAGAYFFDVLPRLASALNGRTELYMYLRDSTHALGPAEALDATVAAAGLTLIETRSMGFGLVRGIAARRS